MFSFRFCRVYVNSTLEDASNKEVTGIAIVLLVLFVSPIIIILMRNAVATIQVKFVFFSWYIYNELLFNIDCMENEIWKIATFPAIRLGFGRKSHRIGKGAGEK